MDKEKLQNVLNEKINPLLKLHNGSCEIVDVVDKTVSVRLNGGCVGCPSSKLTLYKFILPTFQKEIDPEIDLIMV
jgi:Fe/S biogenesis protein NfuA